MEDDRGYEIDHGDYHYMGCIVVANDKLINSINRTENNALSIAKLDM